MKSLLFKNCFDIDLLKAIPYITETENDEAMHNMLVLIMASYSYKPADYLLACYHDKTLTATEIGGAIDLEYADKWRKDKATLDAQYDIITRNTETTRDYNRNIYGYNADSQGVKDYDDSTRTVVKQNFGNVLDNIQKDLALRTKNRYYNIVITDIGNLLTLQIF